MSHDLSLVSYVYVLIIKVTAACNQRLHSQYWLTGHKGKDCVVYVYVYVYVYVLIMCHAIN